jgi:hypothetical protein
MLEAIRNIARLLKSAYDNPTDLLAHPRLLVIDVLPNHLHTYATPSSADTAFIL